MAEQDLLDLEGGNVLAAPADRVLEPIDEAEIAVGLAHDTIAGVEPAIAPGLGGFLRRAEVFIGKCQRLVGPHHQLARRSVGGVLAAIVDDARIEALEHRPHQSGLLVLDRRAEDEIGFGRAPAVEQADAGAPREIGVKLRRHAGRERNADADARFLPGTPAATAGSAPWRRADR